MIRSVHNTGPGTVFSSQLKVLEASNVDKIGIQDDSGDRYSFLDLIATLPIKLEDAKLKNSKLSVIKDLNSQIS